MKKTSILLITLFFCSLSFAQNVSLTVNFKFLNVEEGYDHNTKCIVYIDDEMIGESSEGLQTKGNSFSVSVPTGEHQLKVVNMAEYEGKWEEHTIENNYSVDCIFEESHNFKKNEKLFLVFNLDDVMVAGWKKAPKVKK
ncbi:MAG: hypothetical protein SF052_18040 [Bacteroidia bacterium]|nr:hypothetical protein [Bacteroidia bacterium]